MASFSRGILLPGIRPSLILRQAPSSRFQCALCRFSTAARVFRASAPSASNKGARVARPPPSNSSTSSRTAPASRPNVAPTRYAFVKSLASKPTPTLLYEAPSHFWFYFGCWSSGIAILTWSIWTGPTVIYQPEGVPEWVGYVFGATYVLLAAMSFFLISKTPRIVSTIRLLPPMQTQAALGNGPAATVVPTTATTPQMEVTVKRMVPFLSPKILKTSLENVALRSRFALPDTFVPELRKLEQQRAEEALRKASRKYDMENLLTVPFRHLKRGFVGLFRGVRAAWTDMGFGIIKVDGKNYKVDVMQGYAHDGFRTLERLVDVSGK